MKARIFSLSLAIVLATVSIGCSEQPLRPEDDSKESPPLPPAESMQFDFSYFERDSRFPTDPKTALGDESSAAGFNWLNAAVRVAYINVAIATAFAPPALAWHAALSVDPIIEEDGTFLWTYYWKEAPGHTVQIDLRGRIEGVTIHWNLRVTDDAADPPLDEFVWFYGESNITANSGYWIFHDLDEGTEVEVARIDWDYNAPLDRELVFENIDVASNDYGDRLTYRVDGTIFSITFFDASKDLLSDITWNRQTGTGSLLVPDYNDGERACWDEQQDDTTCPEES